jgi:hypothetical protein
MDLLLQRAKPDGSAVAQIGDEWIRAVAQLGGERSNEVLLSFVDPDQKLFTKEFVPDYQHGNVLARLLTDRTEHDSELKAELFRLANGELPQTKRILLAKTFSFFSETTWSLDFVCCGMTSRRFPSNFFNLSKTPSWSGDRTAQTEAPTLLPQGDRTRSGNAFSKWRKPTIAEAFGIRAARPDRSLAA